MGVTGGYWGPWRSLGTLANQDKPRKEQIYRLALAYLALRWSLEGVPGLLPMPRAGCPFWG